MILFGLSGYSTGANLVTSQAMNDPQISGLLLFSPAFQPSSSAVQYAGLASYFVIGRIKILKVMYCVTARCQWTFASVYYETSEVVREDLQDKHFDKPVFIMMSEGDSVIDTNFVQQAFTESMPNPNNVLVWQGNHAPAILAVQYSMKVGSNVSRTALIWAYCSLKQSLLRDQWERMLRNGQRDLEAYSATQHKWSVNYSAWDIVKKVKITRLTYNPSFRTRWKSSMRFWIQKANKLKTVETNP